jgi:hypothetical protein
MYKLKLGKDGKPIEVKLPPGVTAKFVECVVSKINCKGCGKLSCADCVSRSTKKSIQDYADSHDDVYTGEWSTDDEIRYLKNRDDSFFRLVRFLSIILLITFYVVIRRLHG